MWFYFQVAGVSPSQSRQAATTAVRRGAQGEGAVCAPVLFLVSWKFSTADKQSI